MARARCLRSRLPATQGEATAALIRHRHRSTGLIWGGLIGLSVWIGAYWLDEGDRSWHYALIWMVPLAWGLLHRTLMSHTVGRRLRKPLARLGRSLQP